MPFIKSLIKSVATASLFSLIPIYLVGAIFTNAYIQKYRWEDWGAGKDAIGFIGLGTALWPVYWGYVGADTTLDWMEDQEISLEDILNPVEADGTETLEPVPDEEEEICDNPESTCDTCPTQNRSIEILPNLTPTPTQQIVVPDNVIIHEVPQVFR